jgi:transcriptional regulator with XRE-family HTH domain
VCRIITQRGGVVLWVPDSAVVAERVKAERVLRKWSQRKLAARADVSYAYVSHLEAGKYPRPSAATIGKLAAAFGVSIQYLYGVTDDPHDATAGAPILGEMDLEGRETEVYLMKLRKADPEGYKVVRRQVIAMVNEAEKADREERDAAKRRRKRVEPSGPDNS